MNSFFFLNVVVFVEILYLDPQNQRVSQYSNWTEFCCRPVRHQSDKEALRFSTLSTEMNFSSDTQQRFYFTENCLHTADRRACCHYFNCSPSLWFFSLMEQKGKNKTKRRLSATIIIISGSGLQAALSTNHWQQRHFQLWLC